MQNSTFLHPGANTLSKAHVQKSLLYFMATFLLIMRITYIKLENGQMTIWKTFHK